MNTERGGGLPYRFAVSFEEAGGIGLYRQPRGSHNTDGWVVNMAAGEDTG